MPLPWFLRSMGGQWESASCLHCKIDCSAAPTCSPCCCRCSLWPRGPCLLQKVPAAPQLRSALCPLFRWPKHSRLPDRFKKMNLHAKLCQTLTCPDLLLLVPDCALLPRVWQQALDTRFNIHKYTSYNRNLALLLLAHMKTISASFVG